MRNHLEKEDKNIPSRLLTLLIYFHVVLLWRIRKLLRRTAGYISKTRSYQGHCGGPVLYSNNGYESEGFVWDFYNIVRSTKK